MFKKIKFIAIVSFVIFFSFQIEAEVKFRSKWKSPDAEAVSFSGKKIVVLIPAANRSVRRAAEDALANSIDAHGAKGIAGYLLLTESEMKDKEAAKKRLQEEQVAGAVVIKATTKGKVPVPPEQQESFWKSYSDESYTPPSEQEEIKMYVETLVYSLDQDRVIWTGNCETKTSKLDQFIQELIPSVAVEMDKEGLIKKQ
ncbi:hypothetical protein L0244_02085 [bacterium]|nr:hypothetical protein [bacterium]MCI0611757.1 hypothetical protein [bacterium]